MVMDPLAFQQQDVNIMVRLIKKENLSVMGVIHVIAMVTMRFHVLRWLVLIRVIPTKIVILDTVRNNPVMIAFKVLVKKFQNYVTLLSIMFVDVMERLIRMDVRQRQKVLM
jgi:ABC-type oligopeptide transport system ATPase subunit